MAKTLRNVFSEQGKVDFTEISLTARKALGSEDDPTDLYFTLTTKSNIFLSMNTKIFHSNNTTC
jgi:hypothetical protein